MKPIILYDNVFDNSVVATDTESAGDYAAGYISDLRPFTRWLAASSGPKYLTMPTAVAAADSLGIIGHNLGTASATVSVESSATGSFSGEQVVNLSGFTPSNDLAIFKQLTTPITSGYYVRVKVVTASTPAQIGVLIVGEMMQFPVWPDSPFTPEDERLNTVSQTSKGGHQLGASEYYTPLRQSVSFTNVESSFVDGDLRYFWVNHGKRRKPFFWVPNMTEWPDKITFVSLSSGWGWPRSDSVYVDRVTLSFEGSTEL